MEHVIDGIKITIAESENTKKYAHLFTYESLALLSALHEEMNHERNRLLNDCSSLSPVRNRSCMNLLT